MLLSKQLLLVLVFQLLLLLAFPAKAEAEWPLKGLSEEAELAWQTLRDADSFAFGPIGFAGETSKEELALRILSRFPNAVEIFKLVAREARHEGKFYALVALHAIDQAAYSEFLETVAERGPRVFVQETCVARKEPAADILKRIAAGEYDKHVPKLPKSP